MNKLQSEQAASAAGIASSYVDNQGNERHICAQTRCQLLNAMHLPTSDSAAPLPAVSVLIDGQPQRLKIAGQGRYCWQLQTEQGQCYRGDVMANTSLTLPSGLAQGYHQLSITQEKECWFCRIIVAPPRCFEPPALQEGKKLWGICVQLYTVRSQRNWGMGDFGDLLTMIDAIADRGGDFIGLNPIHALYPANPESASPYSPSSRRWLNIIYIAVDRVADFQCSAAAQQWWQQPDVQQRIRSARESEWVDYSAVSRLKFDALSLAWQQFCTRAEEDETKKQFACFIEQGGDSLFYQAVFDALHHALLKQEKCYWGWPVWPQEYQRHDSEAVEQFCQQNKENIRFWMWLQWLAHAQFDECWQHCRQRNMTPGLYRDLAVGVAEGGAETWCDPTLYCMKASVGAPPDSLCPLGQNWGLPPMDPHVLTARGYQPFIDLLRANMASCGAIRLDHVLSLLRLWWIPYGQSADCGAFVSYPVDDLLAILALESQRSRCMVIGEDLGILTEEIIRKLRNSTIYSWKVLWFEQNEQGQIRLPGAWPAQSIACLTTHDLPTLQGFWKAADLSLGERVGLYPDKEVLRQLYQQREQQKQALLDAMHQAGCVPENFPRQAASLAMSDTLGHAMQHYVAKSESALLGLQPEDWLQMEKPVNVPGTVTAYPNWRRKLTATLEAMFADPSLNALIADIDRLRKREP